MKNKKTVGRSSRTPFKHWMLNDFLGRISEIIANGRNISLACPFHIVDMCAGDGETHESGTSSPQIIIEKATSVAEAGRDVKVTLIERAGHAFDLLNQNTKNERWIEKLNIDSREYRLPVNHRKQDFFINADPNSISDWPLTREFLTSCPKFTTMVITMGCNVTGTKRLPKSSRIGWYDYVSMVVSTLPSHHDCILVSLQKDDAQWAYLLRIPTVWSKEKVNLYSRAFDIGISPYRTKVSSYRLDSKPFRTHQDDLFLTIKERKMRDDSVCGNNRVSLFTEEQLRGL